MTQKNLGKIWALFSIANNYDQPENNLEAWWFEKPNFDTLSHALGWKPFTELDETGILYVVDLWKGSNKQTHPGGTSYRLEEIGEGNQ